MPTQDQYESYDKQVRKQNLEGVLSNISLQADIQKFKDIGDASRIAMILQVIKHHQQKDPLNLENRPTLVCEVWPTGSAWVTWQETKRGQR